MQNELPKPEVVLLGIGHTNAHVLNMWRMQPIADARLTCVSNFGVATYSGMLPGTLAGQYSPADMQIDLVRLCAAAGARLIQAEVTGLDVKERQLLFAERPPLPFDALSVGVGSRPVEVPGDDSRVLRIKPMQTFLSRLSNRLDHIAQQVPDRPWRIAVVGGGAGGYEVVCCLPAHIRKQYPNAKIELTLVDRGPSILKGFPERTQALATQELRRQGIQLELGHGITQVTNEGQLQLDHGKTLDTDLVLWTTSARAPEVLDAFDLPKDERGFLLIRNTLQSTAANSIYAVGDSGTLAQEPTAKAGVFAVRQGPVLWENLQRQFSLQPLQLWQPQASFLTLLNTGDERAIMTYKGRSFHAGWCLKLKDWIDSRFMEKYQDYQPAMTKSAMQSQLNHNQSDTMHCGGCGCKLPADILSRVLAKLDNPSSPAVLLGLKNADDIAVLQNESKDEARQATAVTTDFFTAFLDDPYLLGQIAAQNALSDFYASGAQPQAALAMVTVPHGPIRQQEQFLYEVLAGALQTLRPCEVPIVGGHTIEGEQATVGFTILGDVDPQRMTSKGNLQVGDCLVLTKPLGTGVLLAAHQRAMCQAGWMETLLSSMLASNCEAALIAKELGIRAMTDVTGFGLAGHLTEMLRASQVSAELSLAAFSFLPGALELSAQGVESSLAPGNRQFQREMHVSESLDATNDRLAMLFDPQTSGGLLLGVPEEVLDNVLKQLDYAAVIGRVISQSEGKSSIHVNDR